MLRAVPIDDISLRYKTVQALSLGLLEKAVLTLEEQGWRRHGEQALATPVSQSNPPYWVQVMSRDSSSPVGPA
jgi:hypothetical protein